MKSDYTKYLFKAAKIAIVLGLFIVLYSQVSYKNDHSVGLIDEFTFSQVKWWKIVLSIILVFVNWGLESVKWWLIARKIDPEVTLKSSIKSVIIGVLFSMATPFRLGEYGGRVLASNKDHSVSLLSAHFLNSILQLAFLGIFGVSAFVLMYQKFNIPFSVNISSSIYYIIAVLLLVVLFVWAFRYKLVVWIRSAIENFNLNKIVSRLSVYHLYNREELSKVIFLTITRVLVFYLQYWLIVSAFDVRVGWEGLAMIAIIYACQTIIVFPSLINWFFRGELALIFWRYLDVNDVVILLSTYGLWFINLFIPSVIGLFLIGSFDIFYWFKKTKQ